jgi:hypothetical protein
MENSKVRETYSVLPADGESHSDIIVEVRDAQNNAVPGLEVRVVSSRREDTVIQPARTDAAGMTRAQIQSTKPGTSNVSVVVDSRAFEDTAKITFR